MYKLFLVEDDHGIAQGIAELCGAWGFSVHVQEDFQHVLRDFLATQPHIVVLDITLPFFDGYHWCREIRKVSQVPVLFLSSASDNMNMVMAMNMGADDFIPKPFDRSVLMAKLQALLRRTYDFTMAPPLLTCCGAALHPEENVLRFREEKIPLTRNETRILQSLFEEKGKVVSRENLMQRLWETDSFVDENTLTVNVNRLRKKLDGYGLGSMIATKFGVGYYAEEET